jgi:hypothetical protein
MNLILEHVEEGGLASVVEAEEEDLSLLLPQLLLGQHPIEPIHQEHALSYVGEDGEIKACQWGEEGKMRVSAWMRVGHEKR